ncbi:MAG: hypothetical protein IPG67_03275 [Acidobacteria bacterium]|nr:hypothetical protein [Acidobacteriota bacterium]MBK7933732.1 hypothetical protein [Acidobacteriota bacterium]
MSESVEFDVSHDYNLFEIGINVPVTMIFGGKTEELRAKIDTGSSFCIFRRLHGNALDIEIETGTPVMIGTATGSFRAFGHEVVLNVLGIEITSTVYFAESNLFDRNVLGRSGWLNRIKLGLIEPEGKLFLARYAD